MDSSELTSEIKPELKSKNSFEAELPVLQKDYPGISERSLLNNVLQHSSLILWALDKEGRFILSTGAGLKMIGLTVGEVIGASLFEMYADHPNICEKVRSALNGEEVQEFVEVDGHAFETWYRPIITEGSQINGVVGITSVVTDLYETRKALEKSETRFEKLAQMAPVGIFQCNLKGRIIFANRYFWSCFKEETYENISQNIQAADNLKSSELTWLELFHSEGTDSLEEQWKESLDNGQAFESRLIPRQPAKDINQVLLRLEKTESDGFVGIVVDMTAVQKAESVSALRHRELEKAVQYRTIELIELNTKLKAEVESRKRATQELQLSQNQMQSILENTVDSIVQIDREGRLEYVNHTRSENPSEEVIGSTVFDWLDPADAKIAQETLRRVIDNGEQVEQPAMVNLPDGNQAYMTGRWGPIWHDEKVIGATIVATDVTEMRNMELESKRRQEELAHMSRLSLIGEMSARLSHELKQPLFSIGSLATGCLNYVEAGKIDPAELKTMLQRIARLSNESRDIVENTKDFAIRRPFQKKSAQVQEIIERSLDLVSGEFKKSEILIEQTYEDHLPAVNVDPIQIQQVFVNLIMNSIDAIRVSHKQLSHQITISAKPLNEEFVIVNVSDTGDGFQEIEPSNLFEAFRSTKENGLGMGLAICRGIMENNLGELKLLSTGEEGTYFQINLPIYTPANKV
ncbi:PAS domain-containing sensor histidine kinase [Rubinisphaera italica]|uniref:histidine kinase n=1 Tax=Rubinisphaera italica TaxID=2527969 RepID=A0A5C5XMN6_9PLAN|nr:PAS domain-containing sensor histidine kinase [Rubinisphaera italica]TWT64164.1 Sensor protein FixL [Rubinisphaera italica]